MKLEDLNDEQKAKALACKTPEELLALTEEESYELSEEEMEGIAGGLEQNRFRDESVRCNRYDWC